MLKPGGGADIGTDDVEFRAGEAPPGRSIAAGASVYLQGARIQPRPGSVRGFKQRPTDAESGDMAMLRRDFVGLIGGGLLAGPALADAALAQTAAPAAGGGSAHDFGFDRPEGQRIALSAYAGRPILIVNTATNCGFAGQFASLELLWQRYSRRGLMIIAVPSNDFGGQEPLDGAAIAEAAKQNYGATYPFAGKQTVRGRDAHPFYRWAAALRPAEAPRWNFHKYLVGRDGSLIGGFATGEDPIGPQLVRAIGAELQTG